MFIGTDIHGHEMFTCMKYSQVWNVNSYEMSISMRHSQVWDVHGYDSGTAHWFLAETTSIRNWLCSFYLIFWRTFSPFCAISDIFEWYFQTGFLVYLYRTPGCSISHRWTERNTAAPQGSGDRWREAGPPHRRGTCGGYLLILVYT